MLNQSSVGATLIGFARPSYRRLRSRYLRWRYPSGGYLQCNGIRVFCDFSNDTYQWYDADAPNLAFDQKVIGGIVSQCLGEVFIDIGAHYGFFTASFRETLRHRAIPARIIALEPDKASYRCLQETMRPYRSQDVILLPYAISASDGHLTMYKTAANCLHSYHEEHGEACFKVQSISLDSLAHNYVGLGKKIALIKIDVDGAEPDMFAGGADTIARHRPIIFMEFAPSLLRRGGQDPRDFFGELCDRFHAYWVSYETRGVRLVNSEDYEEIEQFVGDRMTDLLLSCEELCFPADIGGSRANR